MKVQLAQGRSSGGREAPAGDADRYRLLRAFLGRLVHLFYARIVMRGRDQIPSDRPVLFVLNHPNGLLDPMVLMQGLGRRVSFLAKSTFFVHPVGRLMMEAFGALPVFRQRDEGKPGGPNGDARARNEETFARCRSLLRRGEALALFPEGTTHSGAQLLPLRTGAARIALGTEAEAGWTAGLHVVPVGLWYEAKTRFRSAVLLVVGEPFALAPYAEAYAENERRAVDTVTARIEAGLEEVVLQAEHAELLEAIPVLAAWTAPDVAPPDLARQHAWTATLLDAYRRLQHTDPERLDAVAGRARHYAAQLQALGIEDPWRLERPPVRRSRFLRALGWLAATAPFALAGFLLSYGPYRLAGPVATRATRGDATQTGTFKLIGGALFVLVAWIVAALVCGGLAGWGWGAVLLVASPVLGYTALRWGEVAHRLRERASARWLRMHREALVDGLIAERQALARAVQDAVGS